MRKVGFYVDNGGQSVWIINSENRTLTVYPPQRTATTFREHDTLDYGPLLAGLQIEVAQLLPQATPRLRAPSEH